MAPDLPEQGENGVRRDGGAGEAAEACKDKAAGSGSADRFRMVWVEQDNSVLASNAGGRLCAIAACCNATLSCCLWQRRAGCSWV